MATGTAGSTARQYATQQVHYMRKTVVFGDDDTARLVGTLPAGALVLQASSGVAVTEAFDAGTTNTLDIGTSADDDSLATDLALGSVAFVPCDEAAAVLMSADTEIYATVRGTGTAATAGSAEVVIAYIPDNDG